MIKMFKTNPAGESLQARYQYDCFVLELRACVSSHWCSMSNIYFCNECFCASIFGSGTEEGVVDLEQKQILLVYNTKPRQVISTDCK